jgi:hypothetical protein
MACESAYKQLALSFLTLLSELSHNDVVPSGQRGVLSHRFVWFEGVRQALAAVGVGVMAAHIPLEQQR